jgi:phage replication O-like protein O
MDTARIIEFPQTGEKLVSHVNPQKENGFTPIANDILEKLICFRVPGEQRQCLDFIIRKTFGWNETWIMISIKQFADATGLAKPSVIRALKKLEQQKIIIVKNQDGMSAKTYRINKHFDLWKAGVSRKANSVSRKANSVSRKANKTVEVIEIKQETENNNNVSKRANDVSKSANKTLAKVLISDDVSLYKENKEKNLTASPDAGKCSNGKCSESQKDDEPFYLTAKKKKLQGKRLETFNRFWDAFGYKYGKADAADAWLNIPTLTDSIVDQIISAARLEAKGRPQLLESGRTPKMAQGWLSGRRWEDEYISGSNQHPNIPCRRVISPEEAMR